MSRMKRACYEEAGRPSSTGIYVILGVIVLGVGSLVLAGVAFLSSLGNITIGRKPLKPIPVPASSCPYLRQVHDAAEPAGREYLRLLAGRTDPLAWGTEAAQHAQQLAVLELTLAGAIPHVPTRVASELQHARANVAAGRKAVAAAGSATDYVSRSAGQAFAGTDALSNASDLVGNACGFELRPNVSTLDGAAGEVGMSTRVSPGRGPSSIDWPALIDAFNRTRADRR
jgi:hypothetical protein